MMPQNQRPRNDENQNQPEGLLNEDLKASVTQVRKKNLAEPTTGERLQLKQTSQRPKRGDGADRCHNDTAQNGRLC